MPGARRPLARSAAVVVAAAAALSVCRSAPAAPSCGDCEYGDGDETSLLQHSLLERRGRSRIAEANLARAEAQQTGERPAEAQPDAEVCVRPENISAVLRRSTAEVLRGLPPWTAPAPASDAPVRIAYLVQVAVEAKLPLVRRVFDRLYTPQDVFLYVADSRFIATKRVEAALGLTDRSRKNVKVHAAPHADYYFWPRVQVVLDSFTRLLGEEGWDFVVHLSESDYPVHSSSWIRASLSMQRNSNFIHAIPRCHYDDEDGGKAAGLAEAGEEELPEGRAAEALLAREASDSGAEAAAKANASWFWWRQNRAVASCGSAFTPIEVEGAGFPMAELERGGFVFARAPEWVVLSRSLVEYSSHPGLVHFKRLIGMHPGADEIFWSTLVFNIPGYTQKLSRQGWYMRWNPYGWGHSPELITTWHLPRIMQQRGRFFFTRKVDEERSADVLRALDKASESEGEGPSMLQAAAEEEAQWAVPSVLLWGVRCRRPDPGRGEGYAKAEVQEAAAADRDMPLD